MQAAEEMAGEAAGPRGRGERHGPTGKVARHGGGDTVFVELWKERKISFCATMHMDSFPQKKKIAHG
jgi:hypothetical protein